MGLEDTTIGGFLAALASKTPTPGGGAVAGVTAALGAATARMALAYSAEGASGDAGVPDAMERLTTAQEMFLALAEEDAEAYAALSGVFKTPKGEPGRGERLEAASQAACGPPAATIAACVSALRRLQELAPGVNRNLRSDLAIGAALLAQGASAALWNVRVNAPLAGEKGSGTLEECRSLEREAARIAEGVAKVCGG